MRTKEETSEEFDQRNSLLTNQQGTPVPSISVTTVNTWSQETKEASLSFMIGKHPKIIGQSMGIQVYVLV
jgi:hypothetical protein